MQSLGKNIFSIDSFLNEEECKNFINQAEQIGFTAADVNTGHGRAHLTNIRNNERVNLHSDALADIWWNKLPSERLPCIDGMRACGLSPHFRFYKYSPGQKFNMHKDGRQHVAGNISLLTMLVYLNANYTGGSTRFRQDDLLVEPDNGKVLIFEHGLWHQGVKLASGIKYVSRKNILFKE